MGTPGARILVDGTMARGGGGFTYLVNIVPELTRLARDDRFLLLVRSERLAESIRPAPNLEIQLLPAVGPKGRLWFTAVEAGRLARRWGADLYFSAGESAPLRAPCPTIAAFRNPNVFMPVAPEAPAGERLRLLTLRTLARFSAATCARVMFVSEDSARWIGDRMDLAPSRRTVIHHGIDASAWRRDARRPSPHPRPYILSVGSIYRYKNFVRLIEAYQRLTVAKGALPDLVIIGDDQDAEYSRRMREARAALGGLPGRVHLLGEVPYTDVPAWYSGAELFVFPSYLETFGHPLLEAMAAEVPVVASDVPVFREVAADAALYADPRDAGDIARAIEAGLHRLGARSALVKRGRERVRHFSWERSAQGLLRLFSEVLDEGKRARLSSPTERAEAA